MEEKEDKKTVASFIKDIEDYCKKNGLLVPRRVTGGPMVIIPSKSLAEKFKKHHERIEQRKKEQAQQLHTNK